MVGATLTSYPVPVNGILFFNRNTKVQGSYAFLSLICILSLTCVLENTDFEINCVHRDSSLGLLMEDRDV